MVWLPLRTRAVVSYDPNHGHELLQRVIAGMARHPNIGGYVLVGLGCEVNQIPGLVKKHRLDRLRDGEQAPTFLTIQQTGGVRKTVESAVKAVEEMLPKISAANRTMQPVDKLALAMNCGGSDANSGISANPALGVASDELVRQGAASVFGETTEIYGAEHLLTRRAVTHEVGEKLVSPDSLVGGSHGVIWLNDRQQPFAGKQGRRLDHDF